MRIAVYTAIVILLVSLLGCRPDGRDDVRYAPFLREESPTVDSLVRVMTLEQKVGQLIVLRRHAPDSATGAGLYRLFAGGKAGGILLSGLTLPRYLGVIDSIRQVSSLAPFVGTAESVVLNNQFDSLITLPTEATLGAVVSDTLRQRMRRYFQEQVEALGVNLWVGALPVLSTGTAERERWLSGVADFNNRGLLSVAGPLRELSYELPDSLAAVDPQLALYRQAVQAGVSGLRADGRFLREALPEPLPDDFLRYYLDRRISFSGLLVAEADTPGDLDRGVQAGANLFVVSGDGEEAHRQLLTWVRSGRLPVEELNARLRIVLQAKWWMRQGMGYAAATRPMRALRASVTGALSAAGAQGPGHEVILSHFQSNGWELIRRRLYEDALTLAGNPHGLLPFTGMGRRLHLLEYSDRPFRNFRAAMARYAEFRVDSLPAGRNGALPPPGPRLGEDETAVLLLDEYRLDALRDSALIDAIQRLGAAGRLVLVNFREPANLAPFDSTLTVVQLYERSDLNEELAAQLLFGAVPAAGQLPVNINAYFREGRGERSERTRLQYTIPEAAGIAPERLVGIDAIARTAVDDGATPGCQVLVAKDGLIIYDKSFGYHSYDKKAPRPVLHTDLYDVASVTKVAATTLALMRLYDEGAFALNDRLRQHLTLDRNATIRNIQLKKFLIHESGLQPHLPVVPYMLLRDRRNTDCRRYFCKYGREPFTVQVADRFFFDVRERNRIWEKIEHLPVGNQRRFRYSDVNFVVMQHLIEEKTGRPLDEYIRQTFYDSLGLRHTTFRPRERFPAEVIVPTQDDFRWRRQVLDGYVHDEAAALLGGVSGNAGLFSTAEDLAVLFQMLLNGGTYGGQRYLNAQTIELFTRATHGNHRGLGFDKPYRTNYTAMAGSASPDTYGHTGFTGACVWVDPRENLVFVFLSNRVHPNSRNTLLFRNQVRRRIHQVVYDALESRPAEIPELAGG